MLLRDLIKIFDRIFYKGIEMPGDNVGLQAGDPEADIRKIIISLDLTDGVMQEAIEAGRGASGSILVFTHHPLFFEPLSSLIAGSTSLQERLAYSLAASNTALYSAHTNYDFMEGGLNDYLARLVGLKNIKVLEEVKEQWFKFAVFVPFEAESAIREAICSNGGGLYRNYSCCTYMMEGTGTFKPLEGAEPYIGEVGNLNFVHEKRIETIVNQRDLDQLVSAVIKAHPYEEPAYDIYKIENTFANAGAGRIGEADPPADLNTFLAGLKSNLSLENFRFVPPSGSGTGKTKPADLRQYGKLMKNIMIRKAAIINGSANSMTELLSGPRLDCDIVIAGELKYHNALEISAGGRGVVELGHGESEKFAIEGIYRILKDNIPGLPGAEDIEIIKSNAGYFTWRYNIE